MFAIPVACQKRWDACGRNATRVSAWSCVLTRMSYYTSVAHSQSYPRMPGSVSERVRERNAQTASNRHMIGGYHGNWSQQSALGKWVTRGNWRRQGAYCGCMLSVDAVVSFWGCLMTLFWREDFWGRGGAYIYPDHISPVSWNVFITFTEVLKALTHS